MNANRTAATASRCRGRWRTYVALSPHRKHVGHILVVRASALDLDLGTEESNVVGATATVQAHTFPAGGSWIVAGATGTCVWCSTE